MLFTFRRDDEGRETIVVGGVTIARTTGGPEGFEWLNSLPGITAEHVREAAVKADESGFWEPPRATNITVGGGIIIRGPCMQLTVSVPVAETTSTILSVDNSEDQA